MRPLENIPDYLRLRGKWCCWRYEDRDGKRTKIPYNPRSGGKAQSSNPDTFADLDTALKVSECYDGIGLGLFPPLVGVDIDHCVKDGQLSDLAKSVVDCLDSYTEKSPSGEGVHVLFAAPGFQFDSSKYYFKRDSLGLEVYVGGATNRFFTFTGATINQVEISDKSKELQTVLDAYMVRPTQRQSETRPPQPVDMDDRELLNRAMDAANGAKFSRLWSGDWSEYESRSNADMALCSMLAFWTGRDAGRMDRLFRLSGLMRSKWDERRGNRTYGQMTIQEAISQCEEVYTPSEGRALTWEEVTAQEVTGVQEWPEPVPFDELDTPSFPTEFLPHPLDEFVEALAESTQTPEEMAGILSLGVLATAFQSRFTVQISPDWKEPLCLYLVAVAPPGERKSSVISALTKPVYEYESDRRIEERGTIEIKKQERELLEKSLERAKKQYISGHNEKKVEVMDLAQQLADFEDCPEYRLLVDDTTPEKLVALMEEHHGCMTMCSAEGGLFDALQGRYDRTVSLDPYLKAHAGDPIHVDRIGRKGNDVSKPRLTMMLGIQPQVLNGLMANTTFKGRGLCGRFLYAVCKSKVGHREITPEAVPEDVRTRYRNFVRSILAGTDTGVIRLSEEADALRCEYQWTVEQKLGDQWEHMRDWGGKIVGAVLRIAALLHCAQNPQRPEEIPIPPETMETAIKIGCYLEANAESVYLSMGADERSSDAKYVGKKINGLDEISKRDLFQKCHGHFKNVEAMTPAIEELIERGYIRLEDRPTNGRPTKIIKVHP